MLYKLKEVMRKWIGGMQAPKLIAWPIPLTKKNSTIIHQKKITNKNLNFNKRKFDSFILKTFSCINLVHTKLNPPSPIHPHKLHMELYYEQTL